MNIRKKGAGIAFTATLLASLIATVAAPFASASVAVTSAGTIPIGGSSSGTASFTFTENLAACFNLIALPAAGPELQVVIKDSAAASTVHFSGTPVVTAPGSLGATAALAATGTTNDTLNVNFAGSDALNIEQVTISGLTITADTGAATGAISASLTAASNERGCVITGGTFPGDVGTTTATGTVHSGIGAGTTSVIVDVTSSCLFATTGAPVGNLTFTNENKAVGAASLLGVPAVGEQTLTIAATANAHGAGEALSQTVVNCNPSAIGSPGTVAAALTVSSTGATQILPGENNNLAGSVTVSDSPNGTNTLLNGESLTFTISSPASGVVFSVAPPVSYFSDVAGPGTCSLSVDRHTCTVSGLTDGAGVLGSVTIGPVTLDVDSTVPLGTAVKVTVSAAPAVALNGNGVTIAFVGRVIVGTAAQPTVYIGFNDQSTGQISFTESGAGFFVAGVGGNNTFAICPETGEAFTRAPWAVVVTGDLKFLSGLTGASQVKGTLKVDQDGETCAYWTVYSASTVASTIEVRGSADDTNPLPTGANNGPRINVPKSGFGATPGSTQMELLVGTLGTGLPGCTVGVLCDAGFSQVVSNAIRAFKNNITVTAASQPRCDKGATDCLGGNVTVTETQNGQFKAGDLVSVRILPRSTTQRQDVILKTGNTNDLPIVTANTAATGFAVTPVGVNCPPSAILGVIVCQFTFSITQQAFGPGLGSFTISNIHYITAADALNGPIFLEIMNTPGAGQPLDVVVSNALIGAAPAQTTISNSVGTGIDQGAHFVSGTGSALPVTTAKGETRYATWKFHMDPSAVGESLDVQWSTRNADGSWTAFAHKTTVKVDGSGNAYFHWKDFAKGTKVRVRAVFAGNATHGPATSAGRFALFT